MGPIGWTNEFKKLTRAHFGLDPLRLVSERDIIKSYEEGDTPDQLLRKVLEYEVPKIVPIRPPAPAKEPIPEPKEALPLDNSSTTYRITSPQIPGPIEVVSSSDKILEVADKLSKEKKILTYHIEEV